MGVEPQTQGTTKKGESHFRNRILKMPPNNYIPEDLISLKEVNEIMLDAIIDIAYLFFFFWLVNKNFIEKIYKKKNTRRRKQLPWYAGGVLGKQKTTQIGHLVYSKIDDP